MGKPNRQMVSMALLIAALVLFVAFHFLPHYTQGARGFHMWLGVKNVLRNSTFITEEPFFVMGLACFFDIALLTVISPFLIQVWSKSCPAWWLATISSGLGGVGYWVVFGFIYPSNASPNWGDGA